MITNELNVSEINELPTASEILFNSSPQVQELLKFIQKTKKQKKDMKGLIFVQRRFTARILCHVVRRYFNAQENAHLNVHVDFMTGRNSYAPESIETVITNKNNSQVLDKFKRGLINLIIATSVLEEGIDLQDCNFVVAYNVPTTFRSYVQTKGRARMKNSIYAIMVPVNEFVELEGKRTEWQTNSKILKEVSCFCHCSLHFSSIELILIEILQYLVERAVDRPPPQQDDIDKINGKKFDEILKTKNGVTCNYRLATQFLNQYCASLPNDRFTDSQLEEISVERTTNACFVVKIILPIQCPLKEEFVVRNFTQ